MLEPVQCQVWKICVTVALWCQTWLQRVCSASEPLSVWLRPLNCALHCSPELQKTVCTFLIHSCTWINSKPYLYVSKLLCSLTNQVWYLSSEISANSFFDFAVRKIISFLNSAADFLLAYKKAQLWLQFKNDQCMVPEQPVSPDRESLSCQNPGTLLSPKPSAVCQHC